MNKLMKEHKELNTVYEGSAVAPLPTFHEKDHKMKPWGYWAKEQEKTVREYESRACARKLFGHDAFIAKR